MNKFISLRKHSLTIVNLGIFNIKIKNLFLKRDMSDASNCNIRTNIKPNLKKKNNTLLLDIESQYYMYLCLNLLISADYKPSRGTTSDVAGIFSITPSKNTVIASSTVMAKDT